MCSSVKDQSIHRIKVRLGKTRVSIRSPAVYIYLPGRQRSHAPWDATVPVTTVVSFFLPLSLSLSLSKSSYEMSDYQLVIHSRMVVPVLTNQ